MECRRIDINIISASDLENVREMFKMKVYAVVSIGSNSQTEKQTQVDSENETNPAWNCTINYTVGNLAVQKEGVMIVIKLYCKRTLGDRYIGEVSTSIKQLYDHAQANGGDGPVLSYPVQKGSTTSQGYLKLSCSFGEIVTIKKPSLWKKFLLGGALIVLRVTFNVVTGGDMPFDLPLGEDIPILIDPDIDIYDVNVACES